MKGALLASIHQVIAIFRILKHAYCFTDEGMDVIVSHDSIFSVC
ncbi:protein of unknown function [Stenotrophomonas maltophilia]|nr:protein of unknown function [Stenotrophomonas maltophilia]